MERPLLVECADAASPVAWEQSADAVSPVARDQSTVAVSPDHLRLLAAVGDAVMKEGALLPAARQVEDGDAAMK
uniref:Uncharacterized protein n=1 Tax=Aegilops tauschii TaxID=37682 RepID=M8ASD3_AEGTA